MAATGVPWSEGSGSAARDPADERDARNADLRGGPGESSCACGEGLARLLAGLLRAGYPEAEALRRRVAVLEGRVAGLEAELRAQGAELRAQGAQSDPDGRASHQPLEQHAQSRPARRSLRKGNSCPDPPLMRNETAKAAPDGKVEAAASGEEAGAERWAEPRAGGRTCEPDHQGRAPDAQATPQAPGDASSRSEKELCCICMAQPRECAFTPCGHRCACRICGITAVRTDRRCPICRAATGRVIRIIDP